MSLQQTLIDKNVQRILKPSAHEIDRRLPEWARRSNPIVRRQLGVFWKLMTIDFDLIARFYLFNALAVGMSLLVPFLFMLLMPAAVISVVILPALLVVYALALGRTASSAAASMSDERRNGSLDLLLVCPRPLREVLYSKAAAAIWRQIENYGLTISGVAALSLPVLVIQYDWLFSSTEQPLMMRAALLLGLAAAIIRIPLEVALMASVGVAVGSFTRYRIAAMLGAVLLGAAYFGFINVARMLTTEPLLRLLLDTVLPVAAPIPLILLAFRVAARRLESD